MLVHPAKTPLPRVAVMAERSISVSEVQTRKASSPSFVSAAGSVSSEREVHPTDETGEISASADLWVSDPDPDPDPDPEPDPDPDPDPEPDPDPGPDPGPDPNPNPSLIPALS